MQREQLLRSSRKAQGKHNGHTALPKDTAGIVTITVDLTELGADAF